MTDIFNADNIGILQVSGFIGMGQDRDLMTEMGEVFGHFHGPGSSTSANGGIIVGDKKNIQDFSSFFPFNTR